MPYVLRFCIDQDLQARIIGVYPSEEYKYPDYLSGGNYKTASKDDKKSTRKNTLLVDAYSGRIIKTWSGFHIHAISSDGKSYCLLLNGGLKVCRTPQKITKMPLYFLSHFKDTDTMIEEDLRSRTLKQDFWKFYGEKDYNEAIRIFDEFREIPDQQDSDDSIQMERALSRICRKTRLHHYSSPATSFFTKAIFDPGWVRFSFNYTMPEKKWRCSSFPEGGLEDIDYDKGAQKALPMILSKLPLQYKRPDGAEKTILPDSCMIDFRLANYSMTEMYALVSGRKNINECAVVKVDLVTDNAKVVGWEYGKPVEAPNGTRWAMVGEKITVYDKAGKHYMIKTPNSQASAIFSPDSDFILYRTYPSYKTDHKSIFYLVAVIPETFENEPYEVQITQLPPCPSTKLEITYHDEPVFFTEDGMHLCLVNIRLTRGDKGSMSSVKEVTPWLRLSWDYHYDI